MEKKLKSGNNKSIKTLVVIVGPTAIGKTSVSIQLSKKLDTPILSADSRQFFRELNIGTAKPTEAELKAAPHFFINNKSIKEEYNASKYERDALEIIEKEFQDNDNILLVGGSGLYIDAVCKGFDEDLPLADEKLRKELEADFQKKGLEFLQEKLKELDPEFYEKIDIFNSKRLMRAIEVCLLSGKKYSVLRKGIHKKRSFNILKIGLELPRQELYKKINDRVDNMIDQGLEKEVRDLEQFKHKNALQTVGYKEFFDYFDKKISYGTTVEKIKTNSRRYAKRQMTWFKKDAEINWFSPQDINGILNFITLNTINGK